MHLPHRRHQKGAAIGLAKARISAIASAMAGAEPTPFALEGGTVAMLRADWCLAGWPFALADQVARETVDAALVSIGAVRPNWADGQPLALAWSDRECRTCGALLFDPHWNAFYCSKRCLKRSIGNRRGAWHAAELTKAPVRICEWCGSPFQRRPTGAVPRFCSLLCAAGRRRANGGYGPRTVRAASAKARPRKPTTS